MRKVPTYPGEYYHILNRGNNKQRIFHSASDYRRFLFLILFFQSPVTFPKINRHLAKIAKSGQSSVLDIEVVPKDVRDEVIKTRYVELVNFSLMPNHFHLTVKETQEEGIQKYMQRVLTAYTKALHKKYKTSGHVFQGPYQNIHIESDEQLLYLSAYIHSNPKEITEWHDREDMYPWSSYYDYVHQNRWGELLKNEIIMDQFKDAESYCRFLKESGAKTKNI